MIFKNLTHSSISRLIEQFAKHTSIGAPMNIPMIQQKMKTSKIFIKHPNLSIQRTLTSTADFFVEPVEKVSFGA
jgi:hypothetical protein